MVWLECPERGSELAETNALRRSNRIICKILWNTSFLVNHGVTRVFGGGGGPNLLRHRIKLLAKKIKTLFCIYNGLNVLRGKWIFLNCFKNIEQNNWKVNLYNLFCAYHGVTRVSGGGSQRFEYRKLFLHKVTPERQASQVNYIYKTE